MGSLLRSLRHNYILMESMQAATVMGTGDFIAQKFIQKKEELDMKRLGTFTGVGLLFVGPIASAWYHFLDNNISHCRPKWQRGLMKMIPDQILIAPLMLACVLSIMELSTGNRSVEGVKTELENKFMPILINNYKVWPAIQTLNFTLIPVHCQVLVVQLVGVAWNTYLSIAKDSPVPEEPEDEKDKKGKKSKGKDTPKK